MIGSLRGRLLHRGAGEVLVEVAGVGYAVAVSPTTAVALGEVGDEVFVWVHHRVREDGETLYGFGSRDERATFEALLGAHGVGPSLALAILSVHGPADLAARRGRGRRRGPVPGARRRQEDRGAPAGRAQVPPRRARPGRRTPGHRRRAGAGGATADVRTALAGLGYGAEEIRQATAELVDDGDASAMLRVALQRLASAR